MPVPCSRGVPTVVSNAGNAARMHGSRRTNKKKIVYKGVRPPRTSVAVAGPLSQPTAAGSLDDPDFGDLGSFVEAPLHVEIVMQQPQLQQLEATQCGIMFKLHFQSQPGQEVVVVGSDPRIGSWDLQQALKLQWGEGHTWTHEEPVQLAAGQQLQYKYVVLSSQRPQQLWSSGENLTLEVPGMGGCWTLQDAWQLPSNRVVQEGMAPEACLAAASSVATLIEASDAGESPLASGEAAASCEHFVGSEYPVPIKYKCFLCGQCMQPHLHERSCPRGFSDADAQRIFEDTIAGRAHGAERSAGSVHVASSEE